MYEDNLNLWDKIEKIVKEIYRGSGITANEVVKEQLKVFENENSFGHIENATTAYPNIPSKEPLMSQIESFVNDISTNNLESSKTTFFEDLKLHEFLLSQITN